MKCKDRAGFIDFGVKRFIPHLLYKYTKVSSKISRIGDNPMVIIDLSNTIMGYYED